MSLFIATTGKDRFCVEHFKAATENCTARQDALDSVVTLNVTNNHFVISGLDSGEEPETNEFKSKSGLNDNQFIIHIPVEVLQAVSDRIMECGGQTRPVDLSLMKQYDIKREYRLLDIAKDEQEKRARFEKIVHSMC